MDLQSKLRSAVTLGVLTVLLLLGLVLGWTKLTEPLPSLSVNTDETPLAACSERTVTKGEKVDIGEVTVSVFNAGTTDGLATKTLQKLETRGFAPGETGNAPSGTDVRKVQIWADDPKNPAVRLVSSHLGRSVKVVAPTGEPLGVGVVVVVGDDFGKLTQGRKFVRAKADAQVCSPN
jgi:hypothetical protein